MRPGRGRAVAGWVLLGGLAVGLVLWRAWPWLSMNVGPVAEAPGDEGVNPIVHKGTTALETSELSTDVELGERSPVEPMSPTSPAVQGVVTEESTGRPVEGASVYASYALANTEYLGFGTPARAPRRIGESATDTAGRFVIDVPDGSVVDLEVRKDGYARAVVGQVQEGMDISISIGRGRTLSGTVSSPTGHDPPEGVVVRVTNEGRQGKRVDVDSTPLSEDGTYCFQLGPGVYGVWAHSPKYHRIGRDGIDLRTSMAESVDFAFRPIQVARGRVVTEAESPVEGATVTFQGEDLPFVTTGPSGEFEMLIPSWPPCVIRASKAGFAVAEAPVDLEDERDIVLRMHAGATVKGEFFGTSDGPLASTEVYLFSSGMRRGTGRDVRAMTDQKTAVCDDSGRFVIHDVRSDIRSCLLLVAPAGPRRFLHLPSLEPGQVLDLGRVLAAPLCGVRGRVLDPNGSAAADLCVVAWLVPGGARAHVGDEVRRGEDATLRGREFRCRTDSDGAFVLDKLEPGACTVAVESDEVAYHSLEVSLERGVLDLGTLRPEFGSGPLSATRAVRGDVVFDGRLPEGRLSVQFESGGDTTTVPLGPANEFDLAGCPLRPDSELQSFLLVVDDQGRQLVHATQAWAGEDVLRVLVPALDTALIEVEYEDGPGVERLAVEERLAGGAQFRWLAMLALPESGVVSLYMDGHRECRLRLLSPSAGTSEWTRRLRGGERVRVRVGDE